MIYGIYAGSFDPLTVGHLDIIKKAAAFCDRLDVVVANNMAKTSFLTPGVRKEIIDRVVYVYGMSPVRVRAVVWSGLLAEYVKGIPHPNDPESFGNAKVLLIRGLRTEADFHYEMPMAMCNLDLCNIESVFIPCRPEYQHVSSTLVRELIMRGAPRDAILRYTPSEVLNTIREANLRGQC